MFCTPAQKRTANKPHRCTYCGETIEVWDEYYVWSSVDDKWFKNKMHLECFYDYDDIGDGEYIPYENERPR